MKPKLILLGAGGHCLSVIDVVELENKYEIIGVLDNKKSKSELLLGYPILGKDTDIDAFINEDTFFLISVGQIKSSKVRVKLAKLLEEKKCNIATIVSPLAYVSKHAILNKGTVIMHHVILNAASKVGKHCIVNTKANIEHGAVIGDFCHISTGAIVNGDTIVGEQSFIGSNACLNNGIEIASKSIISAGKFLK